MKNIISKTVAVGVIVTMAGATFAEGEAAAPEAAESKVPATEVSVTMDFASAYVFRGVTLNDGAVFQPGLEATGLGLPEGAGALTIGTWGNYDIDDYDNALKSSEFSEVDWYASYSLPSLVDGLDLFVGWTEYTYPMGDSVSDKEGNLGLGYDVAGVSLGATAYVGAGGGINGNVYYDLSAAYALEVSEELEVSAGALVAYLDPDSGTAGWNDGVFDIAASYVVCENWSVGLSVAYIAQLDDEVLVDGKGAYDVDVVGVLSLAGSF
jgi:uncharacterized protein (TIGR02001 family)